MRAKGQGRNTPSFVPHFSLPCNLKFLLSNCNYAASIRPFHRVALGFPVAELYFWRDSAGHEVDLLIPQGNRFMPVEIKSGATGAQYGRGAVHREIRARGHERQQGD